MTPRSCVPRRTLLALLASAIALTLAPSQVFGAERTSKLRLEAGSAYSPASGRVRVHGHSAWRSRVTVEQSVDGLWRNLAKRRPRRGGGFHARIVPYAGSDVAVVRARTGTHLSARLRVSMVPAERPEVLTGFNNNSVYEHDVSPEQSAELLDESGADIDRVQIGWEFLEPTPGIYRFEAFDAIYAADLARGITPLFNFAYAPRWASGDICTGTVGSCHAPPTPEHYDDAARAVAAIAARYPEAAGIEIWNEPNTAYF